MMLERRPEHPYEPNGLVLLLPRAALAAMALGLGSYCLGRLEGGCFWYGPKTDSKEMPVTHIVFSKQTNTWGNFTVPADAIAEMSEATRPLGLVTRAQVHTHPGRNVHHSWYDDGHAISRKALSVVFPFYGSTVATWTDGVGVHEFQGQSWHLLTHAQSASRLRLVEESIATLDLR
jgi:hypothetical protein